MKRAVIYVRESTNFQDPDSQRKECLEYCKKNSLEVVKVYQDIASGANNNRKEFLQLLQDMEEDTFDILVLWELSRSTRDFLMYKTTLIRMKELGKELYSLQEGLLTENNLDKEFSTDIVALVNSHERKRIGRRIKIRREFATREGKWMGGKAPLGYKIENNVLVIDPETAPLAKEIFQLFISGERRSDIAKKFGFQDPKKINRMLVNPVYIGKLKLNATEMINDKRIYHSDYKLVKGQHEALIDEDVFNLSVLLSKQQKREKYINGDFILPNVYSYHGDRMYPSNSIGKRVSYYRGRHSEVLIKKEYLENLVMNTLLNEMDKVSTLDSIGEFQDLEERKEFYLQELNKIERKEEKLLKKFLDERISEEMFDKLSDENKIKKEEFSIKIQEIETLQLNKAKQEDNKELVKKYIELLRNTNDRKELKKILKIIIAEIRLINDFRAIIVTNIF